MQEIYRTITEKLPLKAKIEELPHLYEHLTELKDFSFFIQIESSHTFIGIKPEKVFKLTPSTAQIIHNKRIIEETNEKTLIEHINGLFENSYVKSKDNLPFRGGLFGYIGYDAINRFEDIFHNNKQVFKEAPLPLLYMGLFKEIISINHREKQIVIIEAMSRKGEEHRAKSRINQLKYKIESFQHKSKAQRSTIESLGSNTSKEEFCRMVETAKDYIAKGEVFQIVISHRISFKSNISNFELFQALMKENSSPYMFYAKYPELTLIGSSPEILVKTEGEKVITKPLAGTRHRGKSSLEDFTLEKELLSDEKELAEHIMLVDLARNDIGRICQPGTVKVKELMKVERFPKVMHISSCMEGIIEEGKKPIDIIKAVFPAGTLTGTPKIRAVELINTLEKEARGPYGGAIGFIDFSGDMDMYILIRTIINVKDLFYIQVGAGIVADSIPEKEYQETLNKALGLLKALESIQKGGVEP